MCSTPKTSSSPRRHTSAYTPGFKANHHYWNKMVAERDKQVAERNRLHQQHVADFQLQLKEAQANSSMNGSIFSRLFGYLRAYLG